MNDPDREHDRLPLQSRVFIELESAAVGSDRDAAILACTTLDASSRGLQVAVAKELTEGAFLQIGVDTDTAGDDGTLFLVGQVCWCRPGDNPLHPWVAGLALLPSDTSDLAHWEQLVASYAAQKP